MDHNFKQPRNSGSRLSQPIPPALRTYGGITLAIIASLCAPLVPSQPGAPLLLLYTLIAGVALGLLAKKVSQFIKIIGAALVLAVLILYGAAVRSVKDDGGGEAWHGEDQFLCTPGWSYHDYWPGAELLQNLHVIHTALETYACEHDGRYPLDLKTLRAEGYISQLPLNTLWKPEVPAQHLAANGALDKPEIHALGDELFQGNDFPRFVGNIAYLPDIQTGADGSVYAADFLLVAFAEGSLRPTLFAARRSVITPVVMINNKLDSYARYDVPRQ